MTVGKSRENARKKARKRRADLIARDGERCFRCGAQGDALAERGGLTIDHILPLGMGGTSRYRNLRLACLVCNMQLAKRWKSRIRDRQKAMEGAE